MTNRSGREVIGWMVAGVVVLVGVTTAIVGLTMPSSFGWFAYQPLANATFFPAGESVFLSRTTAIGFVVVTLGLLALAFLAGWRLARGRSS